MSPFAPINIKEIIAEAGIELQASLEKTPVRDLKTFEDLIAEIRRKLSGTKKESKKMNYEDSKREVESMIKAKKLEALELAKALESKKDDFCLELRKLILVIIKSRIIRRRLYAAWLERGMIHGES